ncbi:dicarboxylate/amino acid:cation symporter [Pedobacter steynii]|uniref:C4-dicarboxylate ABC transporter n=1 Tax=Pedobacter steynii TaxID=430522 RepID=A0A1D7QAW3_9SPHI|nr:dicarboxylate/amino acid:cation symporter [Pedobacter steynii]AOM75813.1 C4-dicarboxylate ABC transporter [Pedobacter steynii]
MSKNNRLTFFIFLALILGVALGYFLNVNSFKGYNEDIAKAENNIKGIEVKLNNLKDTTVVQYAELKVQKVAAQKERVEAEKIREKKLEPLTLLSDIFLRLIKMIVAPLVFSTLVVGVAKVGDIKAVGRIGGKTMLWFMSASLLSLVLGMIMVNIFKPGEAMNLPLPPSNADTGIHKVAVSLKDFISHIVPKSMTEAMATNEILQIVVFSLFFGVATAAIGEKGQLIIKFFDAVAHVILKVTGYVMNFAPFAVFGAMAAIVAKQGLSVLSTYALFIGEFYSSMLLLWILLIFIGFAILKKRVFNLMNRMKEPVLVAFSTASSEAAYPKTMLQLERFGCKEKIVSFVLPLGYSFNLDGSMLYMTFASLFIAQSYGIHLSFEQQISMLLILMLTSKGIAGVPRASLVVIAGTIASFNIPEAGLALLIGIDPLLDMGRSATNVIGNSIATAVVSKWEGELSEPQD